MKINNYEAPSVKQYEVRLCGMLNASRDSVMEALGNSSTEETSEYNGDGIVSW